MKGYNVESGYMGWLNGEYVLFSCEADYRDAMEEALWTTAERWKRAA